MVRCNVISEMERVPSSCGRLATVAETTTIATAMGKKTIHNKDIFYLLSSIVNSRPQNIVIVRYFSFFCIIFDTHSVILYRYIIRNALQDLQYTLRY